MKRSLSSLQVRALASSIVEAATIAEAEEIIEECKKTIEKREAENQVKISEFAKTVLPGLGCYYVHGTDWCEYRFSKKECLVMWNWPTRYFRTPIPSCSAGHANDEECLAICPEFTLEMHTKIVEFIKSL
jgi:hypothetical protein